MEKLSVGKMDLLSKNGVEIFGYLVGVCEEMAGKVWVKICRKCKRIYLINEEQCPSCGSFDYDVADLSGDE